MLELLTVILILSLLLMILTPGLIRAREEGRGISCRNNLRQMCLAADLYTNDYDRNYPLTQYTWIDSLNPAGLQEQTEPQENWIYYAWDFTVIPGVDQNQVLPGLLWQGETLAQINQCPSYKGDDNWMDAPYSGYNYNTSYIGHGEGERVLADRYSGKVIEHPFLPLTQIVMSARTDEIRNPAHCVLFGDGQYAEGANKCMRSPWYWEGDCDVLIRVAGTQGYRHNGKTNAGWSDGHVTAQKTLYTDSLSAIQSQLDAYNENNKIKIGFLSSDNHLYDLK